MVAENRIKHWRWLAHGSDKAVGRALTEACTEIEKLHRELQLSRGIVTTVAEHAADPQPLHDAIELVLLDHEDEIDGDNADANISELAYCYRQQTGWTVADEDVNPAQTPATPGAPSPDLAESPTAAE